MCDLHHRRHELLVRGEESIVFAHAASCADCLTTLLAERAYPVGCRAPLLGYRLQLHLDALLTGEGVAPELRAHLNGCPACRIEVSEGRDALSELEPPNPRLRLTCADCSQEVSRELAASCASCSSPHHAPCFDERGHCALPGCADPRYVRALPERRLGLPRWLLGGLIGLVVSAGLDSGHAEALPVFARRGRSLPQPALARV